MKLIFFYQQRIPKKIIIPRCISKELLNIITFNKNIHVFVKVKNNKKHIRTSPW